MSRDYCVICSFIPFGYNRNILWYWPILFLKFITQISRTHKFQTSTFREISSIPNHKNTTPAPPAPDLLVNPRSISTEGKYRTPYSERLMCQNKEQPSFINRKHTHTLKSLELISVNSTTPRDWWSKHRPPIKSKKIISRRILLTNKIEILVLGLYNYTRHIPRWQQRRALSTFKTIRLNSRPTQPTSLHFHRNTISNYFLLRHWEDRHSPWWHSPR